MPGVQISIDRGGTFTDVHASVPGREDIILKVLSVDPANYPDAPTEGVRRVLELVTGKPHPRGTPLDTAPIDRIRMGTTVGTNALLERKGALSALLVTKGFRDLLRISTQSRPNIFDLSVATPELLYQDVVEVDERVTLEGYSEDPEPQTIDPASDPSLHVGLTGEIVRVLQTPDLDAVRASLQKLWDDGYRSLSVVFLHSYVYPAHERLVGSLAREMGFAAVESAALQPMIKAVPRGTSATADAYLTPIIRAYIDSISANFQGGLEAANLRCDFMQSDGGLVDFRAFSGLKSILSGPAGGVVGYAQTSWDEEQRKPVIGFDMGGTSTDCSRFAGTYEHVFETTTAGVLIQSPQLDIITVAAGGGSMLFWRNGLFAVGPESAGAHPGPACYRKGGPLTVTDANLFLGRIAPDYFPHIFGPNENEPLGTEVVADKFAELTAEINADNRAMGRAAFSAEQVALGFLQVASEVMARPIRALTEARGYDTSDHILSCFGGAGGQHACDVAAALSIEQVVIHKYSSILSAYGLSLADLVHEVQRPAAVDFGAASFPVIEQTLADMSSEATAHLAGQDIDAGRIRLEVYLNMRYEGSNSAFMIMQHAGEATANFGKSFEEKHSREFGFVFPEKRILIDDYRVRAVGSTSEHKEKSPYRQLLDVAGKPKVEAPAAAGTKEVCFEAAGGGVDTNLYLLGTLEAGVRIPGPALILDQTQTILVRPKTTAVILDSIVVIELETSSGSNTGLPSSDAPQQTQQVERTVNPIQLSIFGHRFMSIAEQMGRTLQKTAVSTNIKERLDFSCAIFSPDGGLVANAPHVPVHLGSMQFCVRHLHHQWKGRLEEGDVLISNHPSSGGTHLPDITVVTPVFDNGAIVFFVASRGHHADIGGTRPGSMPPDSHFLYEEGAAILGEKLVSNGRRRWRPTSRASTSSRALISEYTLPEVHKYMFAIQANAEQAVRALLKTMHAAMPPGGLRATDYMDDGTPIALAITIDPATGDAVFDFTGTGPQVYGNTNAPRAITHSAIIYCLRALVASDIPLNQGCLAPIDVRIPPNTILSPGEGASVVGGNVLTSQRVTDVVLAAFGACADSSGCMNNLTGFGYYETIGGGAGAGPTWQGTSGVHTHMTNTRITDPEVLEKRYPVLLRAFAVRAGSGGEGAHRGGDGIVRDIEFLVPGVQVSILSERRSRAPRGRNGGGDGGMGRNTWVRKSDGMTISLGGKATASFGRGDRIIIETPGGGGYGAKVAA
ncbi:5-oxoprolinase [Verticillium alfalfae VaMs.102]|uniref:5-oxoprolinase n=1 Tax=Verticillium alfalfae (strain VaMs.102 / ATCC MYA-4576 / FGSC 10136) TaxID=526221 RepID=C9S700_VERA1|nr:5-oxoprolinase [Verticillium alfalfae VaMs.102]EEY14611.1 5-oxoprolinase [Verticillium alfalfae VaMs.102]